MSQRLHLLLLLAVALALRLLAWWLLPYRDFISDEGEYLGAAIWLAQGHGLSFFDGWIWTRPPLYVLFLAAHVWLFGPTALWAPRLTQLLLSLLQVYLLVLLAERLAPETRAATGRAEADSPAAAGGAPRRVGLLAGWALALSYSSASFTYLLLSETLFLTLWLGALLTLLRWDAGRRWRWLVAAGLLLGLAALTKALLLTWLPLAALWLLWRCAGNQPGPPGWRRLWRGLPAAALLTLVVCAVVLPWSAYATRRWGHGQGLILVDTTGGYNFALGAQSGTGQRDEIVLHDTLCGGEQCNGEHAQRQQQAYALGWQWIQQSPSGFLRKTGRELLDLLQVHFGGAERLDKGYTQGQVPLGHLLLLLWDDTLYIVVLLLALAGLLRPQGRSGKGLVVSWLLYNVLGGALVFAIHRFRQPLLPLLFIYAACAVVQWGQPWPSAPRRLRARLLVLLVALLVLPSYLYWPEYAEPGGRRSVLYDTWLGLRGLQNAARCREMTDLLERGELAQARALHDAVDRQYGPLNCLALIHARLLHAEGRSAEALAFLAGANPSGNLAQSSRVLLLEGDLYRRLGQQAAAFARFVTRPVEVVNDLEWAWEQLQPPPTSTIDLGAGLDPGYIRGFYERENRAEDPGNFRWSTNQPWLRFPAAGTGQPQTLLLRVNGWTPNPQPTRIVPLLNGTPLDPVTLQPDWQELRIALPATPAGQDVIVRFESPVFVPGPQDLAQRVRDSNRQILRLVGFQLDWARLEEQ